MFASATNTATLNTFDSLGFFAHRIRAALAGAFEANRVYRRLSALSPAQLAQRGLVQGDIPRMTLQAMNHAGTF